MLKITHFNEVTQQKTKFCSTIVTEKLVLSSFGKVLEFAKIKRICQVLTKHKLSNIYILFPFKSRVPSLKSNLINYYYYYAFNLDNVKYDIMDEKL